MKHIKSKKGTGRNKTNKKGQTEMIGLVILMILIVLGVLFVLRFMISASVSGSDSSKNFETSTLAEGIVSTILGTTTKECGGVTEQSFSFEYLYKDCADTNPMIDYCSGGRNSCQYLNDSIEYILSKTLETWFITEYQFIAYVDEPFPENYRTFIKTSECTGNVKVANAAIPVDGRNVFILLKICS